MPEITAPVTGTVWKITTEAGRDVAPGDTLVILESMKMEIPVEATESGTVSKIHVTEGEPIDEGTPLVTIE